MFTIKPLAKPPREETIFSVSSALFFSSFMSVKAKKLKKIDTSGDAKILQISFPIPLDPPVITIVRLVFISFALYFIILILSLL